MISREFLKLNSFTRKCIFYREVLHIKVNHYLSKKIKKLITILET